MKNILLNGFYGHDNLGDDYILYSILDTISKLHTNKEICVDITCDPNYRGYGWIKDKYPDLQVGQVHMPCDIKTFRRYDYWIIGGGGLFPKDDGKILLKKLLLMNLAKAAGTKICIYAVEINPVRRSQSLYLWEKIRRKCDFVFLRNQASLDVFKDRKNVWAFSDATFSLITKAEKECQANCKNEKIFSERYTLYALARPWSDRELKNEHIRQRYNTLINQIVKCVEADGNYPVFLPFYKENDLKFIKDVTKKLNCNFMIWNHDEIEDKRMLFKNAQRCFCMRYHSVLFALYNATPFISLSYSPKTSALLDECGLKSWYVELGIRRTEFFYKEFDIDEKILLGMIEKAKNETEIEKLRLIQHDLIQKAGIASDRLKKWLSGGGTHVLMVGAKSLGAYGGYETFVDKLTEYHQNDSRIKYHVACKANGYGCMNEDTVSGVTDKVVKNGKVVEFTYHNARCFKINVPEKLGSAQAIYYDVKALRVCCKYIRKNKIRHPVVYIMACRVGPFMRHFYRKIHKADGRVYLNPDGHEWMRAKWSPPVRKYWKFSERMMVKWSDLVICDNMNIEKYIHECYDGRGVRGQNPHTTYIAYGAELRRSVGALERYKSWLAQKGLRDGEYYLAVGRFVPENNYETMIREFMCSDSKKDFAIITNENDKLLSKLEEKLHFTSDSRIKFVGAVYDYELLMKIREQAYGYIHGHEVGGTNPSLLESLGATNLNLLLDVGFNREVAQDTAMYWSKEKGSLAELIDRADKISPECLAEYGSRAKQRIKDAYSWEFICDRYAQVFLRK